MTSLLSAAAPDSADEMSFAQQRLEPCKCYIDTVDFLMVDQRDHVFLLTQSLLMLFKVSEALSHFPI